MDGSPKPSSKSMQKKSLPSLTSKGKVQEMESLQDNPPTLDALHSEDKKWVEQQQKKQVVMKGKQVQQNKHKSTTQPPTPSGVSGVEQSGTGKF